MTNMTKYVTVNLRREYTDAVDKEIEKNPFIGSRAEYIRRAIESFLKENKEAKE